MDQLRLRQNQITKRDISKLTNSTRIASASSQRSQLSKYSLIEKISFPKSQRKQYFFRKNPPRLKFQEKKFINPIKKKGAQQKQIVYSRIRYPLKIHTSKPTELSKQILRNQQFEQRQQYPFEQQNKQNMFINIERYFAEMKYVISHKKKQLKSFETYPVSNRVSESANYQNWKKEMENKKKIETYKRISDLFSESSIKIYQKFNISDFCSMFSIPYINVQEELFKYFQLLIVNISSLKYVAIPIKKYFDYAEMLKLISPKLCNNSNKFEESILFCGLIGHQQSQCFFWLGQPIKANQRDQIYKEIKKFLFKKETIQSYKQMRVFQKIYIVDWMGNLSYIDLYSDGAPQKILRFQEYLNIEQPTKVKSSKQITANRKAINSFFTKKIFTSKILREVNTVY